MPTEKPQRPAVGVNLPKLTVREQRADYIEHMRREYFGNPRYRGSVVTLLWRGRTYQIHVPQQREW